MWPFLRNLWFVLTLAVPALSQVGLQPPAKVMAGTAFNIASTGQGGATFYLIGPDRVLKRKVELGQEIKIAAQEVQTAGLYKVSVCDSSGCNGASFVAQPSSPSRLIFLLHPSRVPVSTPDGVNGTALVTDRFRNTVITPAKVDFRFSPPGEPSSVRSVQTVRGIAWFQMPSRPKQGAFHVVASLGEISEPRVIQQVAAEACGLRMSAVPAGRAVTLQTDPIRDCAGNPVPDGTIVSFTKVDATGRSTVDTPIKKDRAIAKFDVSGPTRISVACGVVLGNEVSLGGKE